MNCSPLPSAVLRARTVSLIKLHWNSFHREVGLAVMCRETDRAGAYEHLESASADRVFIEMLVERYLGELK